MCSPTLLLVTATGVSAAGTLATGIAAKQAGDTNARIQMQMARDALDRGQAEEESARRRTAAFAGEQAAAFGASGAEINTGSSLNILADTAELGELEALRIRNNAEREAFAFESGAAISKSQGANALTSSILTAGGTVLGGAAEVSSRFKKFKKQPGNASATFSSFLSEA